MIQTDKRIDDALLKKIEAAGCLVWITDGVIYSSDDATVQAIIDAYTLDEAKAAVCIDILKLAKQKRDAATADIAPAEMASWAIKLAEAAAYKKNKDKTEAKLLEKEAKARGISLDALIVKVDGNAEQLSDLEAAISGTDGKHRDAVMALTDWAALYAYDYHAGWPV
ncbi:MAG: hypothetical protein LBE62_02205 [Azonexus sp.]|jgi:hypothetical protein|nr:hypothetical protein [Azonexus sp.]